MNTCLLLNVQILVLFEVKYAYRKTLSQCLFIYIHCRNLNLILSELIVSIIEISQFAPKSNSTPLPINTSRKIKFGITEPRSTSDVTNHIFCVESSSTTDDESNIFLV